MSDDAKKTAIEGHVREIMSTLGIKEDDSTRETPARVAKMFTQEIFSSLGEPMPRIMTQDNKFSYGEMLVEKNIEVLSTCEHHLVPIIGVAHFAYIPGPKLVGLSKINRIVDYFSRMPQVQERLTESIVDAFCKALDTDDVALVIDAMHMCVRIRGVRQDGCITRTKAMRGKFSSNEGNARREFLKDIGPIPTKTLGY